MAQNYLTSQQHEIQNPILMFKSVVLRLKIRKQNELLKNSQDLFPRKLLKDRSSGNVRGKGLLELSIRLINMTSN